MVPVECSDFRHSVFCTYDTVRTLLVLVREGERSGGLLAGLTGRLRIMNDSMCKSTLLREELSKQASAYIY